MTKKYSNLEELKKDSVAIASPIKVFWPLTQESKMLDPKYAAKFNGWFSTNNSTLAYVENSVLYVTPFTSAAAKCLSENNFLRPASPFYVPFSNGDYPEAEKFRWDSLREMARKEYKEEFIAHCARWCDEHGFGELPKEVLSKCFEMPEKGVRVKHFSYENTYYPIINNDCLDCVGSEKIGSFCTNNGKVVFVYRNGKTYVAKGYKIVEDLIEAGYLEKGLFVPFSNGETIVDPVLANQWAAL